MTSFLRYQFPAYLWAVMIFASSAIPTEFYARVGFDVAWLAKVVHILFFFFLCLFLNRALRHQKSSSFLASWSVPMSILFCVMFGSLDEVHQMFVAGRHPRVTDVLFDLAGATLTAIMLWLWDRRQVIRRERVTS